ncbi:hypothetical protein HDU87_005686 [Geranomyces variabilis]|uniref:F-box domain-containing protein n=1 Tax=Geranomyces variabilis TaxID=109894 RepID=A0AAD5XNV6_9FUNG|nr:hypothetical protein HDU87_005686 [Geranomyces variabilis]
MANRSLSPATDVISLLPLTREALNRPLSPASLKLPPLPSEALHIILACLPKKDLLQCARVNKEWHATSLLPLYREYNGHWLPFSEFLATSGDRKCALGVTYGSLVRRVDIGPQDWFDIKITLELMSYVLCNLRSLHMGPLSLKRFAGLVDACPHLEEFAGPLEGTVTEDIVWPLRKFGTRMKKLKVICSGTVFCELLSVEGSMVEALDVTLDRRLLSGMLSTKIRWNPKRLRYLRLRASMPKKEWTALAWIIFLAGSTLIGLELVKCASLTDYHIDVLLRKSTATLQFLNVTDCKRVEYAFLKAISNSPNLMHLQLDRAPESAVVAFLGPPSHTALRTMLLQKLETSPGVNWPNAIGDHCPALSLLGISLDDSSLSRSERAGILAHRPGLDLADTETPNWDISREFLDKHTATITAWVDDVAVPTRTEGFDHWTAFHVCYDFTSVMTGVPSHLLRFCLYVLLSPKTLTRERDGGGAINADPAFGKSSLVL